MKKCSHCGSRKKLVNHGFYIRQGLKIQTFLCCECNNKNQKEYYRSLTGDKKKQYIERANRWQTTTAGRMWQKKYQKKYKKLKNAAKK